MEKAGTNKVSGMSWQPREAWSTVPTDSLVARVLCTRHNQAFSPLDAEAGRLIETIGRYAGGHNDENPRTEIAVFCGEELEKWMLKTVCGVAAAGLVVDDGVRLKHDIPEFWPYILFGDGDWPYQWGLYASVSEGVVHHSSSFWYRPIDNADTGKIAAAQLIMNGVSFTLMLCHPKDPSAWGIYRPRTLIFEQGGIEKFVEICWIDGRFDTGIRFSRTGKRDGPPPNWPEWAQRG